MRVHVWVTGRVQGVFYRGTAERVAQGLGLAGWVRNMDDGRVEAVAEGPKDALDQFIAWCHTGPDAARVDDVRTEWSAPTGEFQGFATRR
jgi:acylphosphatase